MVQPAFAATGPAVVGLTLINADTNQPIAAFNPLRDGATINLATLSTRRLNVRANTNPSTVGSVRFGLDNTSNFRTENSKAYALLGNSGADYNPWTPKMGAHTIYATAYTGANGRGTAGARLKVGFTVVDQIPAGPPIANNPYRPNSPHNSGLSEPFRGSGAKPTGRVLNIRNFGATSNNSTNDDAQALRRAIAAAVKGDVVYMPDGVYHFKTINVNMKAGVSLRGQSRARTVVSTVFAPYSANYYSGQVIGAVGGNGDLSISNFSIRRSGGKAAQYGVLVSDSSRVTVSDLLVEGWKITGIGVIKGSKHTIVRNNIVRNGTSTASGEGYGIVVSDLNSKGASANNNWITGNTITGKGRNATTGVRHAIIVSYRAHHNLIANNRMTNITLEALDFHAHDEYSNEARYNVIRGCRLAGIALGNPGWRWPNDANGYYYDSGPNNWVHHNDVSGCGVGIVVEFLSHRQYIEDNYLHANTYGIRFYNGGARNIRILRNRVQNNQHMGVGVTGGAGLVMIGNVVTGNGSDPLVTDSATVNFTITGNDFRSNDGTVRLGSTDGVFANNRK